MLAHEALHIDPLVNDNEEHVCKALEMLIALQNVATDPNLSSYPTNSGYFLNGFTFFQNTQQMARLNSGHANVPNIGYLDAPFANIFPEGKSFTSLYDFMDRVFYNPPTATIIQNSGDTRTLSEKYPERFNQDVICISYPFINDQKSYTTQIGTQAAQSPVDQWLKQMLLNINRAAAIQTFGLNSSDTQLQKLKYFDDPALLQFLDKYSSGVDASNNPTGLSPRQAIQAAAAMKLSVATTNPHRPYPVYLPLVRK